MAEQDRTNWGPGLERSNVLASVLASDLIATGLIPLACPCEFGPGGRYRLEELVAAGTRSLVYRAKDTVLSSEGFTADVAVKVFQHGNDRSHEALSGRRVSHPAVQRVLDRGVSEDGYPYIVSEFIDGGDLSSRPVPWEKAAAARFIMQLCRGVQASHMAGVVHCDLKPSNVMLTAEGEPKLADFDLARSEANPAQTARGNLAFMAPEQFYGHENCLAPPADIYALGGLLSFLLTGRGPHGQTPAEVEAYHASRRSPLPARADDLGRIVARAMAPLVEARYASAAQMADDLESWLNHRPIEWTRPSWWRRSRLWSVRHPARAVLLAGVLVGAVTGVWTWRGIVHRERQRELEAQAEITRKADATVEEIRGKVKEELQRVIGVLVARAQVAEDFWDRMLPALTWIEWIADDPVISSKGELPVVPERISLLRAVVELAEENGRGEHTDIMLARFALAQLLVINGEYDAAGSVLDAIERWSAGFEANDPVRLGIGAMRACVNADRAVSLGGDAATQVRALDATYNALGRHPGTERIKSVVDRVRTRLRRTPASKP